VFRDKIFDTEIVAALGRALCHKEFNIRSNAVEILTAALAQGALRCFYGIFMPKYLIFAEGFRDKILNTEIVISLGRALSHETLYHESSTVVEIFTTALAQGAPRIFSWDIMPTYLQRGFETRYLILRWSPHFDVH